MTDGTSKELVRNLFQMMELPRTPFIPWVCNFAARLEQIPIKGMFSDPTLLSRSLQNAQKLFGYDGIITIFDQTLEAEACGCQIKWSEEELPMVVSHPLGEGASIGDLDVSKIETQGRVPVALEAARRISILKGKEVALLGVVTGPLTLARHLKGDTFINEVESSSSEAMAIIELAQKVSLKLCRAYCERGVDGIVIVEDLLGQVPPNLFSTRVAPALQTIWNVIKYYNAYSILLARNCSQEHVEPIFGLRADGVVISGTIDYGYIRQVALKHNTCFGASIPGSILVGTQAQVRDLVKHYLSLGERKGFFITTDWQVLYNTPIDNMHEVIRTVRASY